MDLNLYSLDTCVSLFERVIVRVDLFVRTCADIKKKYIYPRFLIQPAMTTT